MAHYRQILLEISRALAVLALILFGFSQGVSAGEFPVGASPAVAAAIAQSAVSDLCGGGWGDQQLAHGPCHACRGHLSALPPPPAISSPVAFDAETVDYLSPAPRRAVLPPRGRALSRAPPLV